MRVRRQRWRVLQAAGGDGVVLLTLGGAGASNTGVIQPFITPFDRVEPTERPTWPRRAAAREWRCALRHLIASTAPPGALRAASGAAIDLLPYQFEPALAVVRGTCTRVLLADDVGLGKTIEAGLIVAELRARDAAARILFLTPAGLRDQWRDELGARFGIEAAIADTAGLRTAAAAFAGQPNPWQTCDTMIASYDLIKRPEHLSAILQCSWDAVIVDEAHNAVGSSDRHEAVETIARRTPYVVLVTATPHNGDRPAFATLCGIGAHGDPIAVFRRTRADVHLPSSRRARRLMVGPTPAERRMHEALAAFTRAVRREHGESSVDAWLALAVLNKRALSSAAALQRSAARRLASLVDTDDSSVQAVLPFDDRDGELDPADVPLAWEGGPVLSDAGRERRLLRAVERAAAHAVRAGESKLGAIRRWIRRVGEPVIVFTEYRDTLEHASAALDVPVVQIHGGLTRAERAAALEAFGSSRRVLLATDAAGEGLNLHDRCRAVINLELPWNPVRLEQRIGRVDRIGQRRTVHAITLIAGGTPEQRILARLRGRIARARRDFGAADPLGVVTEADVQRIVLGADDGEVITGAPPAADTISPVLAGEAQQEAARIAAVRHVVASQRGHRPVHDGVLYGISRHRATRAQLAGRVLFVVELTVADGRGTVTERSLIPLAIDVDAAGMDPLIIGKSTRFTIADPILSGLRRCAADAARTFAAARVERERAITAAIGRERAGVSLQPGLFDRRAERAAQALRTMRDAMLDAIARRAAAAERAAAVCDVRLNVRLVIGVPR